MGGIYILWILGLWAVELARLECIPNERSDGEVMGSNPLGGVLECDPEVLAIAGEDKNGLFGAVVPVSLCNGAFFQVRDSICALLSRAQVQAAVPVILTQSRTGGHQL